MSQLIVFCNHSWGKAILTYAHGLAAIAFSRSSRNPFSNHSEWLRGIPRIAWGVPEIWPLQTGFPITTCVTWMMQKKLGSPF